MGNKAGKACGSLSGRRVFEPQPPPNGSAPSAVGGATNRRRSESLEWLNDLVARLWPKIDIAVQKLIHEQVTPQLQDSLPGPFKGTYFKTFTLGNKTPKLGPIQVCQREDGLKLILHIDYQSDEEIEISAVVATLGVKSISLKGQLMLRLGPLIDELPVVGGITAYFIDVPELGLDFTGIGNVADAPIIHGIIQKQIEKAISNAIVLPNMIVVPFASEQQGVTPALLKKPKPVAMLRVTALCAKDLPAMDWNVVTKASSDPFVKVSVAKQSWSSSVVKQNLNPTWTKDDVHDFVVFDHDQHVRLEVFDKDTMTGSDFIGKADPLTASYAVAQSGKALPLKDGSKSCGSLEMKFEWLTLTDEVKSDDGGCVVMVEVEHLMAHETACVVAKAGTKERRTSSMAPAEPQPSEDQRLRADVARRCKAEGLDDAVSCKISGLSAVDLANLEKPMPGPIEFQSNFYLSVPRKCVEEEDLTLTALNEKQKPFAEATLKMSELLKKRSIDIRQLQLLPSEDSDATCCSVGAMVGSGSCAVFLESKIRVTLYGLR